ncbi:MAG TPA: hypothetical protein VGL86_21000 [Polyangia bacterium]|jgi:hypothetical protein
MTVFSIAALSPSAPARADERTPPSLPPSLIERALRFDSPGALTSERALAVSPWIPRLKLRFVVEHGALAGRNRLDTSFFGELAWPFGRRPIDDAVAVARERREWAAARDRLVESIAAAWHARRVAAEHADDVAAELAAEEADATLDALTGDALGDQP